MKRCFLSLLCFFTFLSFGQGLVGERGYNDKYFISADGVIGGDHGSFLIRTVHLEGTYLSNVVVTYTDSMNTVLWSLPIALGETSQATSVCATGDGGVYVAIVAAETCDVLDGIRCQIWKVNALGGMSLFKEYVRNDYHFFEGLTHLSNNHVKVSYRLFGEQAIVEYDELAVLIDSTAVTSTNSFKQFGNANGYNAIGIRNNLLIGFDNSGNDVALKSYTNQVHKMLADDNFLYLTTSDSIFQYDLMLNLINSDELLNEGEIVQLRFIDASTIGYVQQIGNSVAQGTIGTSLQNQLFDLYGTNLSGTLQADFYGNRVAVGITYDLSAYSGVRSALYRKNSQISASVPQTDVALTNFEIVGQNVVFYANPNVYQIQYDLNVTIKNLGLFPVNSIRINRDMGPGICNEQMNRWYFTGLNVQPGDSAVLYLGDAGTTINAYAGPEITQELCVYSSFVNELADLNVTNDQKCETLFHGFVGLEESLENEINLFPNPSSGSFNLSREGNEKLFITVYSVNGSLIQNRIETTEQVVNFSLNAGIYLIQIENQEGNVVIKRVVVN